MSDYRKFNYTNDSYLISCTIEKYERTRSGKCWKSKPFGVDTQIVSPEYYTNYIKSIPFFDNFGNGAYCRAEHTYNKNGYLPTKVISVSPGQTEKHVAKFVFIEKDSDSL